MPRLTKRAVDAAKPQGRERFVGYDVLPGFGLRVLPSGQRCYGIPYPEAIEAAECERRRSARAETVRVDVPGAGWR